MPVLGDSDVRTEALASNWGVGSGSVVNSTMVRWLRSRHEGLDLGGGAKLRETDRWWWIGDVLGGRGEGEEELGRKGRARDSVRQKRGRLDRGWMGSGRRDETPARRGCTEELALGRCSLEPSSPMAGLSVSLLVSHPERKLRGDSYLHWGYTWCNWPIKSWHMLILHCHV